MAEKNQALSLQIIDEKFPIKDFNRIMPTTTHLQDVLPYHKASIETLSISSNVDDKEVFKLATVYKGQVATPVLSLTKLALDKIANILGIEWEHDKCRRTDDRQDPNIIEFSAVGRVKKFDGTWMPLTGTKQIDINAYVDEHRYKCEEKVLGQYGWKYGGGNYKGQKDLDTPECQNALDRSAKKRRIDVSKHKLALAESGAKNRAIRSFGLKSTYTPDELKKQFAVLHLHVDHDAIERDPAAKRAALSSAVGAENMLFNDSTPKPVAVKENIQDADFSEDNDHPTETEKTEEPTAKEKREMQEAEFKSFDFETRFQSLDRMLEKNNITVEKEPLVISKEAFEKRTNEKQVDALMWIWDEVQKAKLAVAETEDNIPV